ncbi:MAG: hydroxyacid dehydrogenase [Acidimicrobiia bacterium]
MRPAQTPDLFGSPQWRQLEAIATILDRTPLETFEDARARHLLLHADVLLTGWGCPEISAEVMAMAPRLGLVAHTGSTVKPIVSDAIWARGVRVSSAAAANAIPVAEFALAAILFVNKGVFRERETYRASRRPAGSDPFTAPGKAGNCGSVVGIVGASRTGRALIQRLRPFDLDVRVHDPVADPAELRTLGATPVADLVELAGSVDVLSIHAPALPQTRHMIGARAIAALRDGATLINTARGSVVDQLALERELASGRISAVLDVTQPEPLPSDSILFDLPNVFLTPHVAGAAGRETQRMADLAIAEIARFANGVPLQHAVTRAMIATIA